jgi:hypothetical protein
LEFHDCPQSVDSLALRKEATHLSLDRNSVLRKKAPSSAMDWIFRILFVDGERRALSCSRSTPSGWRLPLSWFYEGSLAFCNQLSSSASLCG